MCRNQRVKILAALPNLAPIARRAQLAEDLYDELVIGFRGSADPEQSLGIGGWFPDGCRQVKDIDR